MKNPAAFSNLTKIRPVTCFISLLLLPYHPNKLPPNLNSIQAALPTTRTEILKLRPQVRSEFFQTQPQNLKYYHTDMDRLYGDYTQTAVKVSKNPNFTKNSGITSFKTQITWVNKNLSSSSQSNQQDKVTQISQFPWGLLLGLGVGGFGGFLFNLNLFTLKFQKKPTTTKLKTSSHQNVVMETLPELENLSNSKQSNFINPEKTLALSKIDIVNELICDLHSRDYRKQSKAIWSLGQQSDLQAIKPLLDLMIQADSQQRSLILAALSEISDRALTPITRALVISLQDQSPQVRQNAIRDLTRIYDIITQTTQIITKSLEDSDLEVQKTAKYALNQINRIQAIPHQQILPKENQL